MRFNMIIRTIAIIVIIIHTQAFAYEYTAEEAAQILVPYEDDHLLTRLECLKTVNRMIGVTDNITMKYLNERYTDYYPKKDINYNTYLGRFIDLGTNLYDRVLFSRNRYFFLGDEPATISDVLIWVGNISPYKFWDKEDIYKYSVENGLISSDMIDALDEKITVPQFKTILEKILNSMAGEYFNEEESRKKTRDVYYSFYNSNDTDYLYLNVFNDSYKDKSLFVRNDGIYLGNKRIEKSVLYPFLDNNLGIMLMPVRWFASMADFNEIIWDENAQEVILTNYNNDSISFKVGSDICHFVDKRYGDFTFAIPAQNIKNTIYIPMRTVCESFAYDVIWSVDEQGNS